MERCAELDAYFAEDHPFQAGLGALREIALALPVKEERKWGMPVYTQNGKNIFGLARFAGHFGIWFYHGSALPDPLGVLENAQEGKTLYMRHWKFLRNDAPDTDAVQTYLQSALSAGPAPPARKVRALEIPRELTDCLTADERLAKAFDSLTPGKRNAFIEHISEAKRESTRRDRVAKIVPLVLKGEGLHDRYKK